MVLVSVSSPWQSQVAVASLEALVPSDYPMTSYIHSIPVLFIHERFWCR